MSSRKRSAATAGALGESCEAARASRASGAVTRPGRPNPDPGPAPATQNGRKRRHTPPMVRTRPRLTREGHPAAVLAVLSNRSTLLVPTVENCELTGIPRQLHPCNLRSPKHWSWLEVLTVGQFWDVVLDFLAGFLRSCHRAPEGSPPRDAFLIPQFRVHHNKESNFLHKRACKLFKGSSYRQLGFGKDRYGRPVKMRAHALLCFAFIEGAKEGPAKGLVAAHRDVPPAAITTKNSQGHPSADATRDRCVSPACGSPGCLLLQQHSQNLSTARTKPRKKHKNAVFMTQEQWQEQEKAAALPPPPPPPSKRLRRSARNQ